MDYYNIELIISPFEEWLRDILTAQLAESGFEGFSETENGFEAYVQVERFNENTIEELISPWEAEFSFTVKKELVKSRNWNEEWEKNYFRPLVVAGECVVRAPFHTNYPSCRYEIVIEPNMAFGTGNHETTSMMLEAILREDMKGKNVLDMGCGTGILGILASMKGASSVTAIDIDQWSVTGTRENMVHNHITNLEVKQGDASVLDDRKYDIIFANIHKNVLVADVETYSRNLQAGGKILMSGFYIHDLEDISKAAALHGLKLIGSTEKNKWIMAVFQL